MQHKDGSKQHALLFRDEPMLVSALAELFELLDCVSEAVPIYFIYCIVAVLGCGSSFQKTPFA